jgi:molybdopterin molybdotransferase
MIPFHEALAHLLKHAPRMEAERCRIEDASGRVLRQTVRADRAFPPFDRVMMDGYALRSADLVFHRKFRVTGIAPAGWPRVSMSEEACTCIEVMTGAPLPDGADCIVPVEQTLSADADHVVVESTFEPKAGLFVHRAGSDAAEGEVLLRPGVMLGSREIGVAASCGADILEVSKLPRITVIPTGDELVSVDTLPAAHQIRQSNGHAIHTALRMAGFPSTLMEHLSDNANGDSLRLALETSDWLILTGAVSKGSRDFLPGLLDRMGCEKIFHGVAQRPGKPAGFWRGPQGQAIVALPGNPVSALTGLHALVLPALAVGSGGSQPMPRSVAPATTFTRLAEMTYHLPVLLTPDGSAQAAPTGNSGDFIGLLGGDGFVTLPPTGIEKNTYPYTPWL